MYMYTHKQSQNSPTKIMYNKLTCWTKETKNYIYQLRTKLTKAQTEKKTKAKYKLGNKAIKTKLTNVLRGMERKTSYTKLHSSR